MKNLRIIWIAVSESFSEWITCYFQLCDLLKKKKKTFEFNEKKSLDLSILAVVDVFKF